MRDTFLRRAKWSVTDIRPLLLGLCFSPSSDVGGEQREVSYRSQDDLAKVSSRMGQLAHEMKFLRVVVVRIMGSLERVQKGCRRPSKMGGGCEGRKKGGKCPRGRT